MRERWGAYLNWPCRLGRPDANKTDEIREREVMKWNSWKGCCSSLIQVLSEFESRPLVLLTCTSSSSDKFQPLSFDQWFLKTVLLFENKSPGAKEHFINQGSFNPLWRTNSDLKTLIFCNFSGYIRAFSLQLFLGHSKLQANKLFASTDFSV